MRIIFGWEFKRIGRRQEEEHQEALRVHRALHNLDYRVHVLECKGVQLRGFVIQSLQGDNMTKILTSNPVPANATLPADWPPVLTVSSGDGVLTANPDGTYTLVTGATDDVIVGNLAAEGFTAEYDFANPPVPLTGFTISAVDAP